MLHALKIHQMILVDEAQVPFGSGLNVLTGETGSGKSAILTALRLVLGERADASCLRKGAESGYAEAIFDLSPGLIEVLGERGIELDPSEDLAIRREVTRSGKNRVFINSHLASLATLKEVGASLIRFVGQHDNHQMLSSDYHRKMLDAYGDVEAGAYTTLWRREQALQKEKDELEASEAQRLREKETALKEVEEIEVAAVLEGEEQALFEEYSELQRCQEASESIQRLLEGLSDGGGAALLRLQGMKRHLETLVEKFPELESIQSSYTGAVIELEEVSYGLHQFASKNPSNSRRLEEVSSRMALIKGLQRKYGDPLSYLESAKQRLASVEMKGSRYEKIGGELRQAQEQRCAGAQILTEKRVAAAKRLQKEVLGHLVDLNLKKARFEVRVSPGKACSHGVDQVEFYLAPNPGEAMSPVKECASGGELARVLLALQVVLSQSENIPILMFDEVDANIGGETATAVGEKLCCLSTRHQVICITHFPQVAVQAEHHLKITKEEQEGRTVTQITKLNRESREEEIQRMFGGELLYEKSQ